MDLIRIQLSNKNNAKSFKFHVGKGNNGHLIRNLMNQRWWWQSHPKENINDLNFLWTQWKIDTQLNKLPSKIPRPLTVTREKSEEKDDADQANSKTEIDEIDETAKNATKNEICLPAIVQTIDGNRWYNRLEDNFHLTSKKYLYLNMKEYYEKLGQDVFSILPVTFHIKEGEKDAEFNKFVEFYNKRGEEINGDSTKKNAWIIKPGENSNRGNGITVSDNLEEIKTMLNNLAENSKRTSIIQQYIHNPLLINKRKFDIRWYALITCFNEGYVKGYYYNVGYLRTSWKEFTLDNLENTMIHLTNDAVQKHDDDYGKYELANKLSYDDFQKYLDIHYGELSIDFKRDLLSQIRLIITDSMRAVYGKIDPYQRSNTFEILGYDFMIDEDLKWKVLNRN